MRYLPLILLLCLAACSGDDYSSAKINDVSVPVQLDTGYRVVSVDGKAPDRQSSQFVTMVPYVLVNAGEHAIVVESDAGDRKEVMGTFDEATTYRISENEEGELVFILDTR